MSTPRTPAAQAPPAGRYVLDPAGSEITFVTRHMFGLARVRGGLKVTSGVITIADRPENSQAEAEISASSFSTGNVMRDPQVRSRLFLDARRHPASSFRSDSVREHQGDWSVAGFLEVKGRAAPIELNVTDVSSAGKCTCRNGWWHRGPLRARHHDDARNGGTPAFRADYRTCRQVLTSQGPQPTHPERPHE